MLTICHIFNCYERLKIAIQIQHTGGIGMLTFKKSVAFFLSFLTCLIVCMPALADVEQPPVSPRSTLFINYAILSATNASAQGGSSQNESVTVSFVLYHSDGIYVTSGSGSGIGMATANKAVNLAPDRYRMVVTVSNGRSSLTKAYYLTI